MQNTTTINTNQTEHPLVKPEPIVKKLGKRNRINGKISLVLLVILFIGLVCMAIGSFLDKKLFMLIPFYLFILIINGGSTLYSRFFTGKVQRYWQQTEQRRQAAARGDQRLLADVQPQPDAHALTLPITIRQSPRISSFVLLLSTLFLAILIGGISGLLIITHALPLSGHLTSLSVYIMLGVIVLFVLVLGGLFSFFMYSRVRQQITLTESGLVQAGISSKVRSIPWSEARLFAEIGIYGAKKYPYPAIFELASEHEIIRWNWIRKNSLKVWYFANSKATPEEYERQMQGVLAIVAAKTGLPLYDLREEV